MLNLHKNYIKTASTLTLITLLYIPAITHGADLSSITQQVETRLSELLTLVSAIVGVACIIGFIALIWQYLNNKVEWTSLLKWGIGLIAIGSATPIVNAFIK